MLIGELADAAGLPTQTIRFYERRGLLPEPVRGANGYRIYDESTLTRLNLVRTAQAAGLTLAEIGSVIDLRDDGNVPCTTASSPTYVHASAISPSWRQNSKTSSNAANVLIPPTAPTPISATFSRHLSSRPTKGSTRLLPPCHPRSMLPASLWAEGRARSSAKSDVFVAVTPCPTLGRAEDSRRAAAARQRKVARRSPSAMATSSLLSIRARGCPWSLVTTSRSTSLESRTGDAQRPAHPA